jgi:tetratricopeptide (TPR) repeat protein
VFGENNPNIATSLNNLAALLNDLGKYDEAKPLYERSLK